MKWQVQIPTGKWMTGIHTFNTKKAAVSFIDGWNDASNKEGDYIYLKLFKGRATKDERNLTDY